jgi:hypothetical protein
LSIFCLAVPAWNQNGWNKTHNETNSARCKGYDRDFHLYGINWTPTELSFTLDGAVTATFTPGDTGFWGKGNFESMTPKLPTLGQQQRQIWLRLTKR